jgi:hypothetical protein
MTGMFTCQLYKQIAGSFRLGSWACISQPGTQDRSRIEGPARKAALSTRKAALSGAVASCVRVAAEGGHQVTSSPRQDPLSMSANELIVRARHGAAEPLRTGPHDGRAGRRVLAVLLDGAREQMVEHKLGHGGPCRTLLICPARAP